MSTVGYYRYLVNDAQVGESQVKFFRNGALALTATIKARPFLSEYKLIKYLDSSGKYRFFPFGCQWQQTDTPQQVGTVNRFVTSILNDQASSNNIGYKSTRKLSLTASNVSEEELEILQDLYYSPRVYLYVGNGADNESSWVKVTITGDGIGRQRKGNFKKVSIEVTLPEFYSIKM